MVHPVVSRLTKPSTASKMVVVARHSSSVPSSVRTATSAVVSGNRGIENIIKYGPGGRSSVSGISATVFGCTGFLGRYVVNRLGKIGSQVVIPYRGCELDYRHLKVMGDLGQIVPVFYSSKNTQEIEKLVENSNVVFNLIGRDYETKNFSFEDVHVKIPAAIAKASRQAGVSRLIHVSALGAEEASSSEFLQSKWRGEQAVLEEFPDATIVRPASIFGAEDRLLNRIGWLHLIPLKYGDPMIRNGETQFVPVFVSDVAEGLLRIMRDSTTSGKIFEFVGPNVFTYEQLVELFGEVSKRPINPVSYPTVIYKALVRVLQAFPPSPKITLSDVERLLLDEKPTGLPGLHALGIEPQSVEAHAIEIFRRYRLAAYYNMAAGTQEPSKPLESDAKF